MTTTTSTSHGVHLPRESRGRNADVAGDLVSIFRDGLLIGTVEIPDAHPANLELVAVSVAVGTDWRDRRVRARFPSGGSLDYTPEEVAAIEAASTPTERPPFPEDWDGRTCPACGVDAARTLQAIEETSRYWRGIELTDSGTVLVYDDTTADEGDDERIECLVCHAAWARPESIEYG